MAHTKEVQHLYPNQHRNRKNHTSDNTCLRKVLMTVTLWQEVGVGTIAMSDAQGCYDRISHLIAVLTQMGFRLAQHVAVLLVGALKLAKHYITTGFGWCLYPAYGEHNNHLSGSGQGNGIGPALWALISSKLLLMMTLAGHRVHIVLAILRKASVTLLILYGKIINENTN